MQKFIKDLLKKLKLNESVISTILGVVVIIIVGILIVNFFQADQDEQQQNIVEEQEQKENQEKEQEPKPEQKDQQEEKEQTKTPEELPEKYQVQQGDFLWKISEKYYGTGHHWLDIAQENNLTNADLLEKGQELKLPNIAVKKTVSEEIAQQEKKDEKVLAESTEEETISGDKYTVQKGDHLWSIAVRAYGDGYKWGDIAEANDLIYPDFLKEGQELKLPR